LGAESKSQVPRKIRASISSSIACFQAGINIASSYNLGKDTRTKTWQTDEKREYDDHMKQNKRYDDKCKTVYLCRGQ